MFQKYTNKSLNTNNTIFTYMFDLSLFFNDWRDIIVTLLGGAFFYILSNYAIKKYLGSIEKERVVRAKISLLDILESRIINKQNITDGKIENLIRAIEREHSVNLRNIITPRSILEDLELIFEKSHHLDANQKNVYSELIQNEMIHIDEKEKKDFLNDNLPTDSIGLFEKLETEISSNDSKNALKSLEKIKKHYVSNHKSVSINVENKIVNVISILIATLSMVIFVSNVTQTFDFMLILIVIAGVLMTVVILLGKKPTEKLD
jgi:hypothetical protein